MNAPEALNSKLIKSAGLASVLLLLLAILGGCGASTTVQTGPQASARTATRSAPTGTATMPLEPPSKQTPYGTPLVTTTGSSGGWTSYTDPQLGFTLQVPSGWLFNQTATSPSGNLWQWQVAAPPWPAGVYVDLTIQTITAPDPGTQQFCAAKPTTTVAGVPAVIADRPIDPNFAVNMQSEMERDFVKGGTFYAIGFSANLPLPQAQQQLLPFFMIAVNSFSVSDKATGTVSC